MRAHIHPSSLRQALTAAAVTALVSLFLVSAGERHAADDTLATPPSPDMRAPSPAVGAPDPMAAIQRDVEAREYEVARCVTGFSAPNRRQNLRVGFTAEGIDLIPRMPGTRPWTWRWQTRACGRPGGMQPVALEPPAARGSRVDYTRDNLHEWYENRPDGIEQSFILQTPPPGQGPLRIEGRINGDLVPRCSENGDSIDFLNRDGAVAFRYGELFAVDAGGRSLEAKLAVIAGGICLEVNDRDAEYPILVDPLMGAASWTRDGGVANAGFAFSLATAGDVNGDGYSEALVGAPYYDNGAGESTGRIFVYPGSATGLGPAAWNASPGYLNGIGDFGWAVAPAGDVNGDGYDDILVGAPRLSDDQTVQEGHAYLWLGGPAGGAGGASGLGAIGTAANADWEADGDQAVALLGRAVAAAGDVNGDGFDDIIVGAPGYDGDQGELFVWLGGAGGLGADGTPANADWRTLWTEANSVLGWSVAGAGDVNGDGYGDILGGCPHGSNGQASEGGAFLWLGGAAGLGASGTPLNADWYTESNQVNADLGWSVATAGDVNGDGYADVVIGDPSYDNPTAGEGAAYVWLGGPDDLGAIGSPANADWTAEGNQGDARFGVAVATAGDVNGDGFAEVIVGALGYDSGQADEGRASVYFGRGTGLETTASWTADGNQAGAQYGEAVASAGDVNGDGFGDVLVGAWLYDNGHPNEGQAFAYHGYADGLATAHGWLQESNQASAQYGWSIAPAGDVNGDGYSDFIVGAPWYDNGQVDEGRVFVYAGQSVSPTVNPIWTAEGNQVRAHFGQSVAGAGDVNGDGYSDVIVGAPDYENVAGEDDEGGAFLWFGGAAGLGANGTPTNADWSADSDQAQAGFGWSVAGAGDVNGDGRCDVIVGAPYYDEPDPNGGKVFVFNGSASGPATSPDWTWIQTATVASLGYCVAGAGDVNRDGFSDVIVGSPLYSDPEPLEGAAWFFLGAATGLSLSPSWSVTSNQAGADLGHAVAAAGDVNGDGYADVILGAWAYDGLAGAATGLAQVFHGSAFGLQANPAFSVEGIEANTYFGEAVAGAGDVNGDGYSDVVVGGYGYSNALAEEGGAWVYVGSAAGLAEIPSWSVEGNQEGARLGQAVAGAGDVTGDGFGDVLVGLPGYDGPEVVEGRALLYYGNAINGLDRAARQAREDDTAPIDLLGASDSESEFRLKVRGRSAAGRDRVRMQWEVKPLGSLLDGANLTTGAEHDTGAPNAQGSAVNIAEVAGGLSRGTVYHWRLRTRGGSPFFPHSPWLTLPLNGRNETDLRTTDGTTAVDDPELAPAFRLARSFPNPFHAMTSIGLDLPAPAPVSLAIHDVNGRRVATLVDGNLRAGHHEVHWDGRDDRGRPVASGIYWYRITAGERRESAKLVLIK